MAQLHFTVPAGVGGCPWCGASMSKDAVFSLPMIFKCSCGGMWVMTTAPAKAKGVFMESPGERDGK